VVHCLHVCHSLLPSGTVKLIVVPCFLLLFSVFFFVQHAR
jgi:hypothetical protein